MNKYIGKSRYNSLDYNILNNAMGLRALINMIPYFSSFTVYKSMEKLHNYFCYQSVHSRINQHIFFSFTAFKIIQYPNRITEYSWYHPQ